MNQKAVIWNLLKEDYKVTPKNFLRDFGLNYKTCKLEQLIEIAEKYQAGLNPVETCEKTKIFNILLNDFGFEDEKDLRKISGKTYSNITLAEINEVLLNLTVTKMQKDEEFAKQINQVLDDSKNIESVEDIKIEAEIGSDLFGFSFDVEDDLIENTVVIEPTTVKEKKVLPKKVAITKPLINNERKDISTDNGNLSERLTTLESDEIIGTIGFICLNNGVHYYGKTAIQVVKYCISLNQDSTGLPLDNTYSKPYYCYFGQSKVKREVPLMVPMTVKDENGNYKDILIKSNFKPDVAASVTDYMNNGKVESAGFKTKDKLQSLTLYPEKFYVNDPRKNLNVKKTLDKELELRQVVYRANELPENKKIELGRSQAFKSNGKLRDFKTPNGYVGSCKKTKSTIKAGGKSTNNVDTPIFDKGQKFNHPKLGMCQLKFNTNNGEIDLINYHNGQVICRVAKINSWDGQIYQWSFYKGYESLESDLAHRINHLIQPKKVDSKGNINLPQLKILDGLKQQQQQKVTEAIHGYLITSGTIKKAKKKAWNYLNGILNKESHPLFTAVTNENWDKVFFILDSLGLISK